MSPPPVSASSKTRADGAAWRQPTSGLLNQAESKLPADRVALFSTFEQVVHMDVQNGPGHSPNKVQEESK
jgi:hypothetical protein